MGGKKGEKSREKSFPHFIVSSNLSSLDVLTSTCSNYLTASVIRIGSYCLTIVVRSSSPVTGNHVSLECLIANVLFLHCQNSSVGLRIHVWVGQTQTLSNGFGANPFGHHSHFIVFQQIEVHKR
ncbi:hypothetical protein V8G54_018982 [Vigna mungo]|uniref:Uncharacterized protein n=1 Tax=Vigna mungo TaxID=3915 RepID=A0AAQ3NA43_VIGMU